MTDMLILLHFIIVHFVMQPGYGQTQMSFIIKHCFLYIRDCNRYTDLVIQFHIWLLHNYTITLLNHDIMESVPYAYALNIKIQIQMRVRLLYMLYECRHDRCTYLQTHSLDGATVWLRFSHNRKFKCSNIRLGLHSFCVCLNQE